MCRGIKCFLERLVLWPDVSRLRLGLQSFRCLSSGMVISIWAMLLFSAGDPVVASATEQDDVHEFHLTMGERMFRSRELRKAREAFEKVLELNSRDAQAHYFLGLIEYEEGNIEKARTRFQIAYECLDLGSPSARKEKDLGSPSARRKKDVGSPSARNALQLPIDVKEAQLEFPGKYEARIYYRDGWYIKPKKRSVSPWLNGPMDRPMDLLTLDAGSTYRIGLTSGHNKSWIRRGMIGLIIAFSFFLAR